MQKNLLLFLFFSCTLHTFGQVKQTKQQISVNGFRNPSIGLEYRYASFSIHAGYYPTIFKGQQHRQYFKVGVTYWMLPFGSASFPHEVYLGTSIMKDLHAEQHKPLAFAMESGIKFSLWKGLNARLGLIAVVVKGEKIHLNPTPSLNYTFNL